MSVSGLAYAGSLTPIFWRKIMYTIGTHMSIAGGIAKTAENVVKMNANTMQIFSRNRVDPVIKLMHKKK